MDAQLVVGTTLGLITIAVSVWTVLVQRRRKGISWRAHPPAPVFRPDEQTKGGLTVLYEGRRIEDLWLVTVEVENSGNLPILPTDYERPLKITFEAGAEVLRADVTGTTPAGIDAVPSVAGGEVKLEPVLLNPGDLASLSVLFTGTGQAPSVEGRVVGVGQVEEKAKGKRPPARLLITGSLLALLCLGFLAFGVIEALEVMRFEEVLKIAGMLGSLWVFMLLFALFNVYLRSVRDRKT